jgi:eukaryotic-like serine/threonine-protein kinase
MTPVFIFDPTDARNRLPNDPTYAVAARRWAYCPPSLKGLFVHAFTMGLKEPARRVTEGEWQRLFLQLKDGAIRCAACRAVNLWEPDMTTPTCWNEKCRQAVVIPSRLVFSLPGGSHHLLLTREARVLRRHIDPTGPVDQASSVIGQMKQNPNNPNVWGICNLTSTPWTATAADGKSVEVLPQKSVPLAAGLKVNIGGTTAEIVA